VSRLFLQVLAALLVALTAASAYHFSIKILRTIAVVHDTVGVVQVAAALALLLTLVSVRTASGRERLAQAGVRANSWQQ